MVRVVVVCVRWLRQTHGRPVTSRQARVCLLPARVVGRRHPRRRWPVASVPGSTGSSRSLAAQRLRRLLVSGLLACLQQLARPPIRSG